jgi:hypothetical protein
MSQKYPVDLSDLTMENYPKLMVKNAYTSETIGAGISIENMIEKLTYLLKTYGPTQDISVCEDIDNNYEILVNRIEDRLETDQEWNCRMARIKMARYEEAKQKAALTLKQEKNTIKNKIREKYRENQSLSNFTEIQSFFGVINNGEV